MADNTYTREQALEEAYKRGILPADMAAAYEQALDRGLLEKPEATTTTRMIGGKDPMPFTFTDSPSDAEMAGVDVESGAPVGRLSSGFAGNEAQAADNFSKKLSEYYEEDVRVTKGEYGLEFVSPETGNRTLIDEERLTLRDVNDVVAGALPVVGAVSGGIAGMFVSFPNIGAGLGAGLMEAISRGIGQYMDVRDASVGEEALGVGGVAGTEAVAGKLFESAPRAYQGIRRYFKPQVITAKEAERISVAAAQNAAIADEISKRTGQEFKPFTGQLADDPMILGHQQSLRSDPETAARFRTQEVKSETALESFYDDLNAAPTSPNTAVGRSVQLEARDQIKPRVEAQRDITEKAVEDLETITRQLPAGDNSTIVNEATAAAAAARRVIKDEEDLLWNTYKSDIGLDPDTALSNIKIPVEGELEVIMRRFAASAKEAVDPDDASGLFRLQPNAFKPKTTTTMNPVTGRTNTVTTPAEVDLWQLQRYLGSLKRRQRLAGRNEVATDPHGRDIGELIGVVQRQRDKFLKKGYKEIGDLILDAEAKTTQRAQLFDEGLVSQLIRKEQGEWLITDSQLVGGVIATGDRQAMEHLVSALGRHPAGVPTLQKAFLMSYRNDVVENGLPNGTLHRKFMETHKEAIDVLFPGDKSLQRLGGFEAAVTKRIKRFETFEKNVLKTFRGKITDISPENLVTKVFTDKFDVKDVGRLMRLAENAGVGDLYSSAIRGQIRNRFYSPTSGINLNSLDKFFTVNNEKLVAGLGGRYVADMRLLISGLKMSRTSATGIATTRRPGLLNTALEGITRATIARPLSPHGVALTRLINFHQRAVSRAWADLIENPKILRDIIRHRNTDVQTQAGSRILGQVAGGYFLEETPTISDIQVTLEGENK